MTVLVLLEADAAGIRQPSRSALTAARALGGPVSGLVVGPEAAARAAARLPGLDRVLHVADAAHEHMLAEPLAALLAGMADGVTHFLAAGTAVGKNVMPRLAALLDAQPIGDVSAIEAPDVFTRPIYAGNALATVRSRDTKKVLTIRAASFEPAAAEGNDAPIEPVAAGPAPAASARFVSAELSRSERPDLSSARVVISGGRGLGSGENFRLLEPIAQRLHAAIGASRAAVDAGFAPNDHQVGQTGKVVAPELYLAVGISGAIQHLAGMKDSKLIVAINKDADAPIFQVADYGLVADLFTALPELDAALARAASGA